MSANEIAKFDDQAIGRAERNARQVLVDLIRSAGPLQEHEAANALGDSLDESSPFLVESLDGS
jgi:hypothetical protein